MNTIYFLHVPKTGGQTLAMRLASSFPPERIDILGPALSFPRDVPRFAKLISEKSFIACHCSGSMLNAARLDLDLLTTIRDPIAQMASHYLHFLRESQSEFHRAAHALSMDAFFLKFGDLLGNFQAATLMGAFYGRDHRLDLDWGQPRTWSEKLATILDRIRWVVPTESIDEFVDLWQLEVQRPVPYSSEIVNVAERDDRYGHLLDLCRETSERYYIDLVLWHAARQRHRDYHRRIMQRLVPTIGAADASRCFWSGNTGIWLLRGWHSPGHGEPIGRHWWAGPELHSEVRFIRGPADRFLVFSVGVVCGIEIRDIWAVTSDRLQRVPVAFKPHEGGWRCWVDLGNLALHSSVLLCVPRILAPMIADPASNDSQRMSFATHDWGFSDQWPAEVDATGNGGQREAQG